MKRLATASLACLAWSGVALPASAPVWAETTPPVSELVPPYTRVELSNGLTLLLMEHHELPLVNFELVLRSGSIADPEGKEGLTDLMMSLLRKGTRQRSAEQIAEQLDFLGGELELDASFEWCGMSAQFLAKDVGAGLELLADLLLHPAFPADELRKLVDLRVNRIHEAKDNPRRVIGRYYDGFLFEGHAFGRPVGGTETSLPAIKRADVQESYSTWVRPNNAILAVAGDFRAADMRSWIESALGTWERRSADLPRAAASKPVRGRKVLVVDKPDAVQTYFRIGNVGVAKGHPDTAALHVVNTVFGGRFTSWLQNELRTKSGLSYNAHSRFIERSVPGSFYISSFTRTADTEKAVDLALEVLDRLHEKGLTQVELESARNYIRGQFPPRYETAGRLANAMAELEFYGLDRAHINAHTQNTDAVTLDQLSEVIRRFYPRDDLVIVLVGQADEIKKIASRYGDVEFKSVSDPGY
ncbi:MAG: M16 family metallopeptidase [Candidatus Krumholzibacteriia bacterium]